MQYWLDYDEDYFRKTYRERKAAEQAKPKFNRKDLYELGYTDEEIDRDPKLRGDE
jgi:hypothetical protein